MPKQDTLSKRQLALDYGFSLEVLKQHPQLWHLFQQTVANDWTQEKFNAELYNTTWYKNHSATQRAAEVGKATDPAEYRAKLNQARANVRDAAVAMGAQLTPEQLAKISTNVLTFGWNAAQIRDTLAGAVKAGAEGTYGGDAAANADQLRALARANGVKLGDQTLQSWIGRLAAGESIDGFEEYVRKMASSAFPQFAEQLKAGQNLEDVADPYRQQMASTLEINPAEIDLFDPTIRKAMQATDPDGKPMTKPLWKFEQDLKQDPRWRKTNGARDELMSAGQKVLADFGLTS